MRDHRFLEYSPPRAAELQRDLEVLRSLLWDIYTHREQGPYSEWYADGSIEFDLRNLVHAQKDLERHLKRLMQFYGAILLFISSFEEVNQWRRNVLRAARERGRIDADDPDPNPVGVEIIDAIHTLNDWLNHLARDCTWSAYIMQYIRQNVVPLILALFLGVLGSVVAQLLLTPLFALSLVGLHWSNHSPNPLLERTRKARR